MRLIVRRDGVMEPHAWAQFIAEVRVVRPEPAVARFYLCYACNDLLEVAPGDFLFHDCPKPPGLDAPPPQ